MSVAWLNNICKEQHLVLELFGLFMVCSRYSQIETLL